jgi:hypothetical protein
LKTRGSVITICILSSSSSSSSTRRSTDHIRVRVNKLGCACSMHATSGTNIQE